MLLDFQARGFQAYCRAVMEDESEAAHGYLHDALLEIDQRMRAPDLSDAEREALSVASKYLNLMVKTEMAESA
jgi:hypothetical protein